MDINKENKLENIISNNILPTKLNNLENNFKNIKSKYILQKIFNNLEKKKSFNIIKYNKNIKKILDIDINDYKEYSENYSSIEIEIKPVKINMIILLTLRMKIKDIIIYILIIIKKK